MDGFISDSSGSNNNTPKQPKQHMYQSSKTDKHRDNEVPKTERKRNICSFKKHEMIGWVPPNQREGHPMNDGKMVKDVVNFFHGNEQQPRKSLTVIKRVKQCLIEMKCCPKTAWEFCYECERELSENGLPAGLAIDERIRKSPFISAFKPSGSKFGYDTQNETCKDLPGHLERHIRSPLHVAVVRAIATRYSVQQYPQTHGINQFWHVCVHIKSKTSSHPHPTLTQP
jgi:hypothetical protein